jgi:polyisoprenoid-binding protein YceI
MRYTKGFTVAFAVAVVVVSLGQVGSAQEQPPAFVVAPGEINLQASRVYIFVDKTGFGHQHGVEGRLREGNVRIANRSAGRMVFDMQSLKADTPNARRFVNLKGEIDAKTQQEVTDTMKGPDILDVARFPAATFEIDTVRALDRRTRSGHTQYRFEGEFRLHGTKQVLRFTADAVEERGYLHFKGTFHLRQSEYKIPPYKKALGTVGVADVLTVYGDIWVKL